MDAATNGRSTRDRAAAANTTPGSSGSGPSGELIPVLMRIPDVRPPARGKAKREIVASAVKETAVKETVASLTPSAAVIPPLSDAYKPSFEISYPSETAKEKTVHLETPARETDVTASNEKVIERVVDSAVTAAKESSFAHDEPSELPAPAANESTGQSSTNRRQRQRRPAEEPKTSWWKTQGRALAAVFVIGLSVTIYFSFAQRGTTPDTVHEDETAEGVDISSASATHEDLDHDGHNHVPHVASKPRSAAPALTEQPSYDEEPLDDAAAGLDEGEEVEPFTFADSEEGAQDIESDVTSTDEMFGELPAEAYPETDPSTHRHGGGVPRTAQTPNSSSSR